MVKLYIETGIIKPADIKFFIGYSGWSPKQLDNELEINSWLVANSSKDTVMSDDVDDLWRKVVVSLGDKYKQMANYPLDPSLN